MTQADIARINALAAKSRTPEGLTDEEKTEQASLRKRYIESMKSSLRAQLYNTYVVDEKGNKTKIERKK